MSAVAAPAAKPAPAAPGAELLSLANHEQATTTEYEAKRAPLQQEFEQKVGAAQKDAIGAADALSAGAKGAQAQRDAIPPLPKNMAQHIDPKEMNDTAQAFMTLGALLGLASRQPLTAALGNMTAAMKGVQEGDAAQYDKAMQEYKVNTEAAEKQAKATMKKIDDALNDKNLDLTARLQRVRLIEAEAGGPLRGMDQSYKTTMEMLKSKRQALKDFEEANSKVLDRNQRMQIHRENMAQKNSGGAGSGMTPDAVKMLADRYRLEGAEGIRALSAFDKPTRRAVIEQATKDMLAEGGSGAGMARDASEFKAQKAALTQITKDLAAIRPYHDMLEGNIGILKELGAKLSRTDSPWANKTLNYLQTHPTSDPDVTEYLAQMRLVQTEASRVINNPRLVGQLTDSARHEIDGIVNGDMAIASSNRVVDRLLNDAGRRVSSMEKEQEHLLQRKPAAAHAVPPKNAKGWVLHTDKDGNRAYVGPNKEIEEVK